MASIRKTVALGKPAAEVWAVLRDVGRADRAFPGVLSESRLDEDGVRTVKFANGFVAREQLIDVDDNARRIAYSVISGPFTHHHAVMQLIDDGDVCRLQWDSDFLPDAVKEQIEPMVQAGVAAISERFKHRDA
ncbi:MAG: SRPBCC family protein [Pseudomonadota bacterium]|nr:SRPBCC family protein [Pseudomonadota bacterium]